MRCNIRQFSRVFYRAINLTESTSLLPQKLQQSESTKSLNRPNQLSPTGTMSYQEIPTTRPPHLEFVYRLRVHMDPMNIDVGAPHGAGFSRMVMNIKGGTLRGPGLEGTIVEHGGADWGTAVEGSKVCLSIFNAG